MNNEICKMLKMIECFFAWRADQFACGILFTVMVLYCLFIPLRELEFLYKDFLGGCSIVLAFNSKKKKHLI